MSGENKQLKNTDGISDANLKSLARTLFPALREYLSSEQGQRLQIGIGNSVCVFKVFVFPRHALFDNYSSLLAVIQFYLLQPFPDDLKDEERFADFRCSAVANASRSLSGACSRSSLKVLASSWSDSLSRSVF